jgi:hypothetical protein
MGDKKVSDTSFMGSAQRINANALDGFLINGCQVFQVVENLRHYVSLQKSLKSQPKSYRRLYNK